MAMYRISAEHVSESGLQRIRDFCAANKIRVTKAAMSETFTDQVSVRISADPKKKSAAKVRNFIWDHVNGGAWCEIAKS
jgi:hypothetical protein